MMTRLALGVFLLACLSQYVRAETNTEAQAPTTQAVLTVAGHQMRLESWETVYIVHAMERLLASCKAGARYHLSRLGLNRDEARLELNFPDDRTLTLTQDAHSTRRGSFRLYSSDHGLVRAHRNCDVNSGIPITALMEGKVLTRQSTPEPQLIAYQPPSGREARLTSYESNLVGWTFDDNDVSEGYLDAVVSLKYPFLHTGNYSDRAALLNPFFAFTGRFSQYIESRDSSPVVGKRFNPKFFLRHWLTQNDYLDFGYAHESNGQNINTREAYLRAREDFRTQGQDPDFARDSISRGWDFLTLDWRYVWAPGSRLAGTGRVTSYVNLKYFLDDGFLQGEPEEYNDWEGDGVNRRRDYDGLSLLLKYDFSSDFCLGDGPGGSRSSLFCLDKAALRQTTGYNDVFENNTTRLELSVSLLDVPFTLWAQTGYNSDLVDYYRDVDSWGIALELQSYRGF